jgi:hypothetical protein
MNRAGVALQIGSADMRGYLRGHELILMRKKVPA